MDIRSLSIVLQATCRASECFLEDAEELLSGDDFVEIDDTREIDVIIAALPVMALTGLFVVSLAFIIYALVRVPRGTMKPGGALLPANRPSHVL